MNTINNTYLYYMSFVLALISTFIHYFTPYSPIVLFLLAVSIITFYCAVPKFKTQNTHIYIHENEK